MAQRGFESDERGIESATIGVFRSRQGRQGRQELRLRSPRRRRRQAGQHRHRLRQGQGSPAAVEKATKDARRRMVKVSLAGRDHPHEVTGKFGASTIRLVPARPGTGIKAGRFVRPVLELVGIRDILTKAYGSTNKKNLSKAALAALQSLRTSETITEHRGVTL